MRGEQSADNDKECQWAALELAPAAARHSGHAGIARAAIEDTRPGGLVATATVTPGAARAQVVGPGSGP